MPWCSLSPIDHAAAVHVQQHRRVGQVRVALPVDVEQAALAVLGVVGDVLEDLDLVVVHPERHRELAQGSGQVQVGVARREPVAVVLTERLDERPVDVPLGEGGLRDEAGERGRAAGREQPTGAAVSPSNGVRRVGRRQREQVRCELAGQPAGRHGRDAAR